MLFSRRDLLWLPAAGPLAALTNSNGRRRNVLLVAVDDLNNRIGCYGDPVVKTPNIDRLASRGVRFDRAYCNYPVCNASRTSLLSGRRPETTRVLGNSTPPRTYLGDVVMLPEYFHSNGYFTARVGKIAHGTFEHEVKWDISESGPGRERRDSRLKKSRNADQRAARKRNDRDSGRKLSWTRSDAADEQLLDGYIARRIAALLEQNKDKPFFIGCGFHKPHLPWIAPRKYFDMYSLDQIQLPATPVNDRDDIPPMALTQTNGDDKLTDQQRREAVLAYYAATSFMDAQLGIVLDTMDRLKLWDNTVVLLFGDHGWHLYDHLQLWRKMTVFEQAARAPLIVAAPGSRKGVGCPRLVEFVDIYPTLVELAGLEQPQGLEGTSFAPLLNDPQRKWKPAAYTMVTRGRNGVGKSVRTERYRYTEWNDGRDGMELYDHETDINEWTNLAGNAKLATVQKQLQELLRNGQKSNRPPGA